jgi:NhaP-type Na+/H+ or K+/H+ antiporter
MHESTILIFTGICFVSIFCQWVAWWLRLPAILFLLISGFLLGPVFHWVNPDELFGDLLFPLVSLAVAIILFEGSLTLKLSDLSGLSQTITRLVTVGALITWLIIGCSSYFIFGFSWQLSVLFGALCVVTGPTVIMPMLRTVRPNEKISHILRWEGILIDPIGALLTVVTFEFIVLQVQGNAIGHTLYLFVEIIVVGSIAGIAAGYLLGYILRRHWLPEYLHNLATLSVLFSAFALSNHFAEESGLLAVTLMGIWLANMRGVNISNILNFKENLTVLFISGLFILLAARLDLTQIQTLDITALFLFLTIQLVARPVSIWVSSLGSGLNWREKCLLSWIAPRGIVAAAVSALFALRLEETSIEDANLLVPLTFMVIVGTVVLQSSTSRVLAKWLKVSEPPPKGVLIMGANPVARCLGEAIKRLGVDVILAGTSRSNVNAARLAGLDVFYGNPASEYADQRLTLVGMGKLLALSPNSEINTLVAARYKNDFGKHNMYSLAASIDTEDSDKHRISHEHRNYQLLANQLTYKKLASVISQGWQIKKTKLTEAYTFADYLKGNKQAIQLFFFSPKEDVILITDDVSEEPGDGWMIVSLVEPDKTNTETD